MSTHKHFDKICCVVLVLTLILTFLFMNASHFGIEKSVSAAGYESRLFDTSSVHTIDIVMEDWDSFISTCTSEEYASCTVVIDGEAYKNVAIRAKGNTSLTQVASYGNDRYSFKLEFDHYDSTRTYYGLDKLCLNNVIQDNTYIKDYLTFQMMAEMGVASPLCSYANISVNGETWGLYLAVESIEESFLQRNYGTDYGELYKPDSMSMGGGRGNGKDFEMNEWDESGGETKALQRMLPPILIIHRAGICISRLCRAAIKMKWHREAAMYCSNTQMMHLTAILIFLIMRKQRYRTVTKNV